jgi:four helix bundle protein
LRLNGAAEVRTWYQYVCTEYGYAVFSFVMRWFGNTDAASSGYDPGMHDFRKLEVWRMARELGTELYLLCAKPKAPAMRLITTQLARSALSISANIAEECGKSSRAETIRYLEIAGGSAAETEHHLIVAIDTGILGNGRAEEMIGRVASIRRMLRALIQRLPP